ncbi:MAG: hypothetical protein KGY80_13095 [Candidatus Thorarchaeota archaeon]|nr:hypothetical protein [Candidatus Thorarchaeota archaeon]
MIVVRLLLLVLFALSISSMMSGFLIARRMGYYLMKQVMVIMLGMIVGLGTVVVGFIFAPASPTMFDILHLMIALHFLLFLVGTIMELAQVLPILLKTMQGAPIHSSHITNLLLTTFVSLGLVLMYADLALIIV